MKNEKLQALLFGLFMLTFYALRMFFFGNEPISAVRIGGTIFSCALGAFIFYFGIRFLNNRRRRREEEEQD